MNVRINPKKKDKNAYPTETKLAHYAPSTARLCTPVLDGCGAGIPSEGVELELSLVPDLWGEGLVTSYVEVGTAGDLIREDTSAGFHITNNTDFCHCEESEVCGGVCGIEE